ncbi:hypothetical protein pb186bvf_004074 [Paramecium bursaria]
MNQYQENQREELKKYYDQEIEIYQKTSNQQKDQIQRLKDHIKKFEQDLKEQFESGYEIYLSLQQKQTENNSFKQQNPSKKALNNIQSQKDQERKIFNDYKHKLSRSKLKKQINLEQQQRIEESFNQEPEKFIEKQIIPEQIQDRLLKSEIKGDNKLNKKQGNKVQFDFEDQNHYQILQEKSLDHYEEIFDTSYRNRSLVALIITKIINQKVILDYLLQEFGLKVKGLIIFSKDQLSFIITEFNNSRPNLDSIKINTKYQFIGSSESINKQTLDQINLNLNLVFSAQKKFNNKIFDNNQNDFKYNVLSFKTIEFTFEYYNGNDQQANDQIDNQEDEKENTDKIQKGERIMNQIQEMFVCINKDLIIEHHLLFKGEKQIKLIIMQKQISTSIIKYYLNQIYENSHKILKDEMDFLSIKKYYQSKNIGNYFKWDKLWIEYKIENEQDVSAILFKEIY